MVTALWVLFDLLIVWKTSFLNRSLSTREKVILALVGLAVAGYGGYSEHADSVVMSSLKQTATETASKLTVAQNKLTELSKGQEFNRGQLDVIGKISGKTLELLASKTGTSPSAGGEAVGNAAVNRIDELSKQVVALQLHTMTSVISPDVEAQIVRSLRAAETHPVYVNELAGNQNAVAYANQWVNILKAGGWLKPNDYAGSFMPFGGSVPVGLSFQVKGPGIPEGLQIFGRILKANNIPYDSHVAPSRIVGNENTFALVVGANP